MRSCIRLEATIRPLTGQQETAGQGRDRVLTPHRFESSRARTLCADLGAATSSRATVAPPIRQGWLAVGMARDPAPTPAPATLAGRGPGCPPPATFAVSVPNEPGRIGTC